MSESKDNWSSGDPYEYFMGRWSTLMAPKFLTWLNASPDKKWLDIGCGTGALSEAITHNCKPKYLSCIDPSENFIEKAKKRITFQGDFSVGNVEKLPFESNSFDIAVSGLALNFFPSLEIAISEIKRILKPGGITAAYVWDYSGRMEFIRYFWDEALKIDIDSKNLDEGFRFPICNSDILIQTFQKAGIVEVESSFLDIDTVFNDFNDYWNPFLGGQGPAPSYLASLSDELQQELRNKLYEKLKSESDGSIKLLGRAIAVKGKYY